MLALDRAVIRVDEEVVYAGVAVQDGIRWWRYVGGELQPLLAQRCAPPSAVAAAILRDFAQTHPSLLQAKQAGEFAADFVEQFFFAGPGQNANFVESHRIQTWLAVLRMCGRVR